MTRTLWKILLWSWVIGMTCHAVEESSSNETRLYLKDLNQEVRTTSVNWFDLDPMKVRTPQKAVERGLRILIDVGHGGRDTGANGLYGISEKEYCLRIGKLVKQQLEREGKIRGLPLDVLLSRDNDTYLSLKDRVRLANEWSADLFLSLHLNSSPYLRAHGFEVYFLNAEGTDEAAAKLARIENQDPTVSPLKAAVLSILEDAQSNQHVRESSSFAEVVFQAISRKVRSNGRGVRQAPFTVLAGTSMPSVLIEVGYVTHAEEARKLTSFSYLKRVAGAISQGIIEFATSRNRPTVATHNGILGWFRKKSETK